MPASHFGPSSAATGLYPAMAEIVRPWRTQSPFEGVFFDPLPLIEFL
jgi:hypothetical protein